MPSNDNIKIRIRNKKDSSSNWSSKNPILLDGELGIESDTGLIKIGDGTTTWNKLKYSNSTRAEQDSEGNLIIDHYATKTELSEINGSLTSSLTTHTSNKSNPHGVTKSQIGLGNVDNTADSAKSVKYATSAGSATKDSGGNTISDTYATKTEVSNASSSLTETITAHTSNKSNPHGVTKSQVGLGNVDNTADSDKSVKYATSAGSATKATQDGSGNNIVNTYATKTEVTSVSNSKLNLSGGTLTGTLTAKGSVYEDTYTGALNMNNSNIYGVNGIYTADLADSPSEGINFYNTTTAVDSIHAKSGTLYFTPNRTLGANGTSYKIPAIGETSSNMTAATSSAAGKAGLVPAPAAGAANRYLRSDGTWQVPPDTNTTYSAATSSVLGLVKVGSNITNSSGTISLTKANVVNALGYTPPTSADGITLSSKVAVSASTQSSLSSDFRGDGGDAANGGYITVANTTTGISAGTFTLQNLLQQLVNKSHTHSNVTIGSGKCYYDYCSSSSCFIKCNILTPNGYKDIKELKIGDEIFSEKLIAKKIVGIVYGTLDNRKAIRIKNSIFTEEHAFLLKDDNHGAFNPIMFNQCSNRILTSIDNKSQGTYLRKNNKELIDLSKGSWQFICLQDNNYKHCEYLINIEEIPANTITYTLIVEDCEWCIVDGIITACARKI